MKIHLMSHFSLSAKEPRRMCVSQKHLLPDKIKPQLMCYFRCREMSVAEYNELNHKSPLSHCLIHSVSQQCCQISREKQAASGTFNLKTVFAILPVGQAGNWLDLLVSSKWCVSVFSRL